MSVLWDRSVLIMDISKGGLYPFSIGGVIVVLC